MRAPLAKWMIFTLALLVGAQGLFAISAPCPKRSDQHRCCRETKRPVLAQVKQAPPCAHCLEKNTADRAVAVSAVFAQMQAPVFNRVVPVRPLVVPAIAAIPVKRDIPPLLKIPLRLRQILI